MGYSLRKLAGLLNIIGRPAFCVYLCRKQTKQTNKEYEEDHDLDDAHDEHRSNDGMLG